jgi:hypothetical protein
MMYAYFFINRRSNSVYAVMVSGIAVVTKSVQVEPRLHAMVMGSATKQLEYVSANLDGAET